MATRKPTRIYGRHSSLLPTRKSLILQRTSELNHNRSHTYPKSSLNGILKFKDTLPIRLNFSSMNSIILAIKFHFGKKVAPELFEDLYECANPSGADEIIAM